MRTTCRSSHRRLEHAHRLLTGSGTLYLHVDYREAHYCKLLLDELFGRESFLNEIIWAYDYGARARRRWPAKHDTILVYVKDPRAYFFDPEGVDREPYMAPGLVTAEKAAKGKLPTDVWWHTIVATNGREKTGYPTQKPEGIVRRIVQASTRPGDWCLDFFAGSGTLGAVAAGLGRRYVLIDCSPEAIDVCRARLRGVADPASQRLDLRDRGFRFRTPFRRAVFRSETWTRLAEDPSADPRPPRRSPRCCRAPSCRCARAAARRRPRRRRARSADRDGSRAARGPPT